MRADFIPGLSIELRTDGQALREYADDETIDGENATATRYVEAVPNTEFSVHTSVESSFRYRLDDLRVSVCVDGQEMTGRCYPAPAAAPVHYDIRDTVDNINGVGYRRILTFGELKTTDESLPKAGGSQMQDALSRLGEVTVCAQRVKITSENAPHDSRSTFKPKIGDIVPEKALKGRAISNRVTLKDGGTCRPQGTTSFVYPYGREKVAIFTFQYRTRRDLQVEGIIPRSPSPDPAAELDFENMTREEAIDALRKQRAEVASSARVKRERATTLVSDSSDDEADDDEEGDVSIITAGPVRKRQRISKHSGVDTIDLTEE